MNDIGSLYIGVMVGLPLSSFIALVAGQKLMAQVFLGLYYAPVVLVGLAPVLIPAVILMTWIIRAGTAAVRSFKEERELQRMLKRT